MLVFGETRLIHFHDTPQALGLHSVWCSVINIRKPSRYRQYSDTPSLFIDVYIWNLNYNIKLYL